MQGIFKGTRNQQNNQHLRQLCHQSYCPGSEWAKDFIRATTLDHVAVNQATEQPFDNRRDHAAQGRHATHGVTMQSAR
ncbi:hypothetical protein D3C72_1352270 [compost metagenome]